MFKVTKAMIEEVVSQVCGADTVPIVMNILGKANVSEFLITEDLGLDIREFRRRIYKLWEAGFVYFKRKKDKKRGWYIYYWTFIPSRVVFLYEDLRRKRLAMLRERLEREENNNFYICPNGCVRLDFSRAVEFDFRCPECGALLVPNDNSKTIEHLKEEIARLESELKDLEKLKREYERAKKKSVKSESSHRSSNAKKKSSPKNKSSTKKKSVKSKKRSSSKSRSLGKKKKVKVKSSKRGRPSKATGRSCKGKKSSKRRKSKA